MAVFCQTRSAAEGVETPGKSTSDSPHEQLAASVPQSDGRPRNTGRISVDRTPLRCCFFTFWPIQVLLLQGNSRNKPLGKLTPWQENIYVQRVGSSWVALFFGRPLKMCFSFWLPFELDPKRVPQKRHPKWLWDGRTWHCSFWSMPFGSKRNSKRTWDSGKSHPFP